MATISRFEKWVDDDSFCEKYYSQEELNYIRSRGRGATSSMAAGFAAKEALGKALGIGLAGLSLKSISVLRNEKGKPYFHLNDKMREKLNRCGQNPRVHLSLSHEERLAIAQVIIEVDDV